MRAFALGETSCLPGDAGKRRADLIKEAAGVSGDGGLVKHGGDFLRHEGDMPFDMMSQCCFEDL